jgi:hypothetical protein
LQTKAECASLVKCTTRCTTSWELPTQSIGSRQLKNLSAPLELFRAVMPWEDAGTDPEAFANSKRIAVLPLR